MENSPYIGQVSRGTRTRNVAHPHSVGKPLPHGPRQDYTESALDTFVSVDCVYTLPHASPPVAMRDRGFPTRSSDEPLSRSQDFCLDQDPDKKWKRERTVFAGTYDLKTEMLVGTESRAASGTSTRSFMPPPPQAHSSQDLDSES